jgi:nucleoside-diphosphate-sugar epimerase
MNILVTGHHGYIGSVMAPVLVQAGHKVAGVDTFFYEGCDLVPDGIRIPSLRGDIRELHADTLERYDAVVHLAALSNDPLGSLDPRLTIDINLDGTLKLARAARAAGVQRFVFASSCSMYGASSPSELVTEEAPLSPLTPYAESKVRAEEALTELADEDFSPVFMRNATAYGVSPRLRADVVLNNLVGWAFTTGQVKVLSDGTPCRPIIHVQDVARAALAILEAPVEVVHNQAFNIGANSENYLVSELADIVRETVPGSTVEYAEGGGPDPRSYKVDFGKLAREIPEYCSEWTARDGASELLGAYREVKMTLEAFQSHKYFRLKHLQLLLEHGSLDNNLRWNESADAVGG